MTSDGHSAAVVARTAGAKWDLRILQSPDSNDHVKIARCADPNNIPAMDKAKQAKNDARQSLDRAANYLLTPAALHFKVIVLFQIGNNLIQRRNYMEFIAAELVSSRDLNFGR